MCPSFPTPHTLLLHLFTVCAALSVVLLPGTALFTSVAMAGLNANPTLFAAAEEGRADEDLAREADPDARDPLDNLEVFEMIRHIKDPEHPHTLEQLRVAQRDLISVDDTRGLVRVHFTPTIPHCSMATLIGLCIRVKLLRSLPSRFKVDVNVRDCAHPALHIMHTHTCSPFR